MGASNVGSGRTDGIFVQFWIVLRTILGRQRAPNPIPTRRVCVDMAEEEERRSGGCSNQNILLRL